MQYNTRWEYTIHKNGQEFSHDSVSNREGQTIIPIFFVTGEVGAYHGHLDELAAILGTFVPATFVAEAVKKVWEASQNFVK